MEKVKVLSEPDVLTMTLCIERDGHHYNATDAPRKHADNTMRQVFLCRRCGQTIEVIVQGA